MVPPPLPPKKNKLWAVFGHLCFPSRGLFLTQSRDTSNLLKEDNVSNISQPATSPTLLSLELLLSILISKCFNTSVEFQASEMARTCSPPVRTALQVLCMGIVHKKPLD